VRRTFNVSLHSAKDPSSSFEVARLGTFDSLEPVTFVQGSSSYVFFSLPLNTSIIERMLQIRDNDEHVAFKVRITIAATYYRKEALLLYAVASTLVSLTPTASAQTQGGCGFSNTQSHYCNNPHEFAWAGAPPIPNCNSPNAMKNSNTCRDGK
jgi:hypothetical protein